MLQCTVLATACVAPTQKHSSTAKSLETCVGENLQEAIDTTPENGILQLCAGEISATVQIFRSIQLQGDPEGGTHLTGDGHHPVIQVLGGVIDLLDLEISGGFGATGTRVGQGEDAIGGGVEALESEELRLTRVNIHDNEADWGAGVMGPDLGRTEVNASQIHHNVATKLGGGIWMRAGEVEDTDISANEAPFGGGLAIRRRVDDQPEVVSLAGTQVAANQGWDQGGGLHMSGPVSATGGKLSANLSQMGGNLHAFEWDGTLTDTELVGGEGRAGGGNALIEDSPAAILHGVIMAEGVGTGLGMPPPTSVGGGLWVSNSVVRATNLELVANEAHWGGGAMVASSTGQSASLHWEGGRLASNIAHDRSGGLVLVGGHIHLVGLQIEANVAPTGAAVELAAGNLYFRQNDWMGGTNEPADLSLPDGSTQRAPGLLHCGESGCGTLNIRPPHSPER
jgi:hypothetical protein